MASGSKGTLLRIGWIGTRHPGRGQSGDTIPIHPWSQSFSYDPFGNIKKTNNGGATAYSANYSTATNQVSSGISPAPLYDQNGNQKNLTASSGSLTWNALNQPITFNASTSATYDALGRMVETYNSSSGVAQQFVFRPSGAMLAVYNAGTGTLVKGTIPLPGGETAIYNSGGLSYIRHTDWLGSSRFSTTWAHAVYAKESYAPFGETYNEAGTADRSFTGQDQDVVTGSGGTGVYDFLYRKHDPSAGRWLSPDPSGWSAADISNPQSLNRYAYALNNPLSLIDLTGLDACAYDQGDGTALVYQSSNPQWQGDCPGDGIYIESDQSISSIGFDGYVWQGYDDDIVVGQSNDVVNLASIGADTITALFTGIAPSNPICSRTILQSKYTKIFGQMGQDLNVNPAFIMTTAVQESGWGLSHVYGTNSSSNGQPLNNLFGAAPGGGNNKAYPSVWASAQAWENNWGPQLTNNPQTIQAYVADLLSQPHHMYNTNPGYASTITNLFPSVQNAITTCKVTF